MSVEVLAAQLVTKRERGKDIGTERAMGGRAEDPIQSTAGRPPREEEEKGRLSSLGCRTKCMCVCVCNQVRVIYNTLYIYIIAVVVIVVVGAIVVVVAIEVVVIAVVVIVVVLAIAVVVVVVVVSCCSNSLLCWQRF